MSKIIEKQNLAEIFNELNKFIQTNNIELVTFKDQQIYLNNYINYIYIDEIIDNFKKTAYVNPGSIYKIVKDSNLNIILSMLKNIESDLITVITYELYVNMILLNKQDKKVKNIVR